VGQRRAAFPEELNSIARRGLPIDIHFALLRGGNMFRAFRASVAMWLVAVAACAGENTFTPLVNSSGESNTEANTGEWSRPDLGTAADIIPLKTRVYATKESVTDGVAMKWFFEKGAKGVIAYEKGKIDDKAAGFTLYAKAFKPLQFRICTNVNQEKLKVVEIGTEWKKYDFPFAEIGYNNNWWQIIFQVIGPIEERTWLILDRVGVEGPGFIAEPKVDPKTGPDETISSKDILYGAENLAKTVELLKKKQPFKIFALGDSVTAGAQTMRGTWGVKVPDGVPFRYFGTVARLLEEEYGYKGITPVACGHGGWTTKQLMTVVDKEVLEQCGPNDLVFLQAGGNDLMANTTVEQWKADMKQLIAKVKTKTDQIIVVDTTVARTGKVIDAAAALSKTLQEIVAEEKVGGADVTKFLTYRGPAFACALLANGYHPDFMGHIVIGEMIAPIFTGKHKNYPE
jgi:lysophospholipase L1-like esterase